MSVFPYNKPVDGSRGAPMGRADKQGDPDYCGKLNLRAVPLYDGGYDKGGAYWGCNTGGEYLFCAWSPDGSIARFLRAASLREADAEMREEYPRAEIGGVRSVRSLPVIFRAQRSGDFKGDVTAVFPTVPSDNQAWTCMSYAHVGQHGGCSWDWYRTTRPATPEEYADLLRELEGIYEDGAEPVYLDVQSRWIASYNRARWAEQRRA